MVGVMPPTFQFPDQLKAELFIPATLPAKVDWNEQLLFVVQAIARLKPGVTLERAGADLSVINQRLIAESPILALARSAAQIKLLSLHKKLVGDVRPALLLLFGSVGLVLLVACANVANLQLARAATRHREMAVRAALGAARHRLARQLIIESLLVTAIGGAIGILICHWSMDLLRALTSQNILFVQNVRVDAWVLLFTFVVVAVIGVLSGLAPALVASKPDLNETLQQGSPRFAGGHGRVRSLLVVFQLALTVVLLIGWGLLIRSFIRLTRIDPGFDPRNVLTAKLERSEGNDSEARLREFFERLLESIQTLPGVQSVGATSHLPLAGYFWLSGVSGYTKFSTVTVEGRPHPAADQSRPIPFGVVSSSYFQTMGIPLLAGRHFRGQDRVDAPGVAIINEASARRFFPDEDPIGRRVQVQIDSQQAPLLSVVGVVREVRHLGLDTEPSPEIYVPYLQHPVPFMTLVVRTQSDPKTLVPAIKAQVFSLDKDLPVYDIATLQERIKESVAPRLHNLWLLGIFAALALILAAVGVYGMMAYSVTQRTQEIGIRIGLGAEPHDVLKLVVRQGAGLTLIGVGVGLTVALALTRVLSSLLFGVTATDPVTFGGVALLLTAVALLACYIPARRATKVDPVVALRHE
jgi:putative ABC transport system permease protein